MSAQASSGGPLRSRALGERERALMDFERDWAAYHGAKESAIRERFGVSGARYYQLLNRLIATPEARAYDPLLVARLLRRRDARVRRETGQQLGRRPCL